MHSFRLMFLVQRLSLLAAVVALAAGTANGQSDHSSEPAEATTPAVTESSSAAGPAWTLEGADGAAALPSAPSPNGAAGAGQGSYDSQGGGGFFSRMAWELGAGFNAPAPDSSDDITWGGNFTLGGGYRFNRRLSALIEYQFISDKLPGRLINEVGATGGYAHIWSFTASPVFDIFPKSSNDVYITGGGGFYRKVTSFTDPELTQFCYYYYCGIGYTDVVVGHFSSNQGGWNVGAGYQHRMGGMYGDSRMKLFAEARYLNVLSPATNIAPNGLGVAAVGANTKLIPVTFGVRW
jgi:Outer membrane protein beta-barrel domain